MFSGSPGIAIDYGYRFHRYFQAEIGLDTLFGAANVRDFIGSGFGALQIRDREFFLPLGGRAILPFARGRLLISGGGGGAYMRYAELLRQPSDYFRVDCPVCTSRSGWGSYALAGVPGVSGEIAAGEVMGIAMSKVLTLDFAWKTPPG